TAKAPAGRGGRRGPRGPRAGSKTAFILSQGFDLPARDVVEAAAKAGHTIDANFVYAVRSSARAKGAAPPRAGRGASRSTGRSARARDDDGPLTASGSLESQFARLAVDIGIARAESILRAVRQQ